MASASPSLADLQREFLERVTADPDDDGAAATAPETLIAKGDLGVYAGMYSARLRDAVADDYPKLHAALGDDAFLAVTRGYLRAHPPRSFTLRDAGLALPDYLREVDIAPAWAADLAALERARVEVFDGPDALPLSHAEVVELGAELPEAVLAWVPSSVVVTLGHSVDDLWSAIEDEQPGTEPEADQRVVLVWRRELSVLHRTLDLDEAELAQQLAIGVPFSEICSVLAGSHGEAAGQRAVELLVRWLEAEVIVQPAPAA